MADIDVVPKRGTSTWIWIVIAAVIVVAILWMAFGRSGGPSRQGSLAPLPGPAAIVIPASPLAPAA